MRFAAVVAAAVLSVGGGVGAAQATAPAHRSDSLAELDVPYLAQGRLLCGGAAAAMVERFFGRRGVYSRDYSHLVRPSEGGIRTTDLAAGLEVRGYEVEVSEKSPDAAFHALSAGLPSILLVRSGPGRYHYVVLVGRTEEEALVHDPLVGPSRRVDLDRLERLRAPAGYWTLVARPTEDAGREARSDRSEARGGGERTPTTLLGGAMADLRAGREIDAERKALEVARAAERGSLRELAWQLVATARVRAGRTRAALDAWNRLGEPLIDLIVIRGVQTQRWPVLADRLPFAHGDTLTSRGSSLGARRLEALPAVSSARVAYRPLLDGSVEVHAFVAERSRWPGAAALVAAAGDALVDREVRLETGPLLTGAGRWRLSGSWLEAASFAKTGFKGPVPGLSGVVEVTVDWGRQRFRVGGDRVTREERLRAGVAVSEWLSPADRVGLRVGVERWLGEGRRARLGAFAQRVLSPERLGVRIDLDGWSGAGANYGSVTGRIEGHLPRGDREWRLSMNGSWAGADAPRSIWSGAGLGRVREPLLRGRRLVRDGAVDASAVFGPRLVQASLEHGFLHEVGPVHGGVMLFIDGARAWGSETAFPEWAVSWGLQLEAAFRDRRVEASLGTGSGDWIFSVRLGTESHLF